MHFLRAILHIYSLTFYKEKPPRWEPWRFCVNSLFCFVVDIRFIQMLERVGKTLNNYVVKRNVIFTSELFQFFSHRYGDPEGFIYRFIAFFYFKHICHLILVLHSYYTINLMTNIYSFILQFILQKYCKMY